MAAIIFTYEGSDPGQETIRRMAEALINTVGEIKVETMQNFNLTDEEVGAALLSHAKKNSKNTISVEVAKREIPQPVRLFLKELLDV